MIPLALQLLESPGGALIADFSDATVCNIDNGRHGFRSLTFFAPMSLELAFTYAEQSKAKWLSLNYGCGVAWEGRVEDPTVRIVAGGTGLEITAFGSWRGMYDVPYTALWSATGTADWFILTTEQVGNASPEKFAIDNNNRIYLAAKKGEIFDFTNVGRLARQIPDDSQRDFLGVQFDYEFNGASPWRGQLNTNNADWSGGSSVWSIVGTGSVQSGSVHLSLAAKASAQFVILYSSGTPATYTGETGDTYLKITNLRLVTATTNRVNTTTTTTISAGSQVITPASMANIYVGQRLFIDAGLTTSESVTVTAVTSTTFTATFANAYSGTTTIQAHVIYADEIIKDLVSHTAAVNSEQLSDSTALIESPGLDLLDEVYEDAWPGDIATKLAGLGDNQTPPRLWEVGVWENQELYFQPRGSDDRVWAVDADEMTVNSTLEQLRNSQYATYQDANGRTLRTAVADDDLSQSQYDIVRRGVVRAQTTSETQAEKHRDAALDDGKTIRPRSQLQPDYLMDQTGAIAPKWLSRSGQTMNIRNLPVALGDEVDRVRTFLLEENSYDVLEDILIPVPEQPPASLEFLVARRSEGVE